MKHFSFLRRFKRLRLFLVAVLIVVTIGTLMAGYWFNELFEEKNAKQVDSLVAYFKAQSVLGIFAHADDETLAAGFLADAGQRNSVFVHTITLTRGEAGYPDPPICRKEDLKLVREAELRCYGFFLGIDRQDVWDYPDGKLSLLPKQGQSELVDRLVEQIRRDKPDLILSFDPDGGYSGHIDHQETGRLTTRAIVYAADSEYKPELGSAHVPDSLLYILAPKRALQMLGDEKLRTVAKVQPSPNYSMPIDKVAKLTGWRTHTSQHLDQAYPVPGWLLFEFFDQEHFLAFDPVTNELR
ncbi:PIG-L deacetylase family protein [Thalassoroseus pseudoceratinae]|uniref:PIG-L deacetylase family protein n=1 Tax=Thalassoroseus pseudoceratinae TaxID=2713176 RepID=UPI001421E2AA|nr:PIG-L family deacetylase [Thalassoroseus pseudoceratinae]